MYNDTFIVDNQPEIKLCNVGKSMFSIMINPHTFCDGIFSNYNRDKFTAVRNYFSEIGIL